MMNPEDKETIRKVYFIIREMLMSIEDFFDKEEILQMQPYIKNEMMQILIENKVESQYIEYYINTKLKQMGILEARPNLAKEISGQLFSS